MATNINKKSGILQVLPALFSGGVERVAVNISNFISKSNYKSFIASAGGKMISDLSESVEHFTLPLDKKNPLQLYRNINSLVDIITKNNIKIIHAHSRAPAWSAYFASRRTGCKFITTVHGAHSISNDIKAFYNSIMTKGSKVIAVSNFIKDYLINNYQVDSSKIETIYCGIDLNYFNYNKIDTKRIVSLIDKLRIPTDKPIVLVPGRLSRNKGQKFIIETIKNIKSDVTCLLVGGEQGHLRYRKELQEMINQYNLGNKVILTNSVDDMPAMYSLSDIVISTSTKPEALGLVAIEAQAMGRMIIANATGGSVEAVDDKKTGWLINPDDKNALIRTINEILNMSTKDRIKKATLAREYVEKDFSLVKMEENMMSLYDRLLK